MNIILVGFMGCGKSSAAKFISKQYDFRFVDTDKIIEKRVKLTVSEIFKKYGEFFFRKVERDVIKTNLSFCNHCVIATGGGLPCHFNNMDSLKKMGWVFYLKLNFDEIIKRVKNKANRPLFNDMEEARLLYNGRKVCYEQAHFIIDADKQTCKIAKDIMSKINP